MSSASSQADSDISDVVSPQHDALEFLTSSLQLTRLGEGVKEHDELVKGFVSGLAPHLAPHEVEVLAVHRNIARGPSSAARLRAFSVFRQAVATRNGGDPNVKLAWYGGSRDELSRVVSFGFCGCSSVPVGRLPGLAHGCGVYLSPAKYPVDCVKSAIPDDNGVRHMLLCRVIMGNMEEIPAGSTQSCPSSDEFDSGVDNLLTPRRYIVWCSNMNTHIFPEFVLSFRLPDSPGGATEKRKVQSPRPSSPWISFGTLFSMLPEYLDPAKMALISRAYDGYRKNKFTRLQLIRKTRQVAGDGLLTSIIKSCSHELKVKKPNRAAAAADRVQAL